MESIEGKPTLSLGSGPDSKLFASRSKRSVVCSLLLVVATLALYNPVSRHPFVNFDDDRYVSDNMHVRTGLCAATVAWAFRTFDQANWHPLTWLSHAADVQLFGLNPAGHHYTNVVLHAANVVLLFLLLERSTGSTGCSLAVAALFAVHPLNVESVAWISERKNLLSMFFFLLALSAYQRYAARPSVARYLLVAACFALGSTAKPQVITLPFVLLLWDYWPLERWNPGSSSPSWIRLTLEKLPLFAISAASAVLTWKSQLAGGAVRSLVDYSFRIRLENALVAYLGYLTKAFWPADLSPLYPHPGNTLPGWRIGLAAVVLSTVSALIMAFYSKRYLLVGWLWMLGTLVPMIGLVQVGAQAMADRYAYLPLIGVFILVVWGSRDLARRAGIPNSAVAAAALVTLAALSLAAERQLGYWSDNLTLWSHALAVTRGNYMAEDNLGGALLDLGRSDQAMLHFRAALAIRPDDPQAILNLGSYEQQHGNLQAAIDDYGQVLKMSSDRPLRAQALSNLGVAYRTLGDKVRARESFQLALAENPFHARALLGLGLMAQKEGDLSEAIEKYSQSLAIQPTDYGYLLLAQAFGQSGNDEQARQALAAAKRLSPDLDTARSIARGMLEQ